MRKGHLTVASLNGNGGENPDKNDRPQPEIVGPQESPKRCHSQKQSWRQTGAPAAVGGAHRRVFVDGRQRVGQSNIDRLDRTLTGLDFLDGSEPHGARGHLARTMQPQPQTKSQKSSNQPHLVCPPGSRDRLPR